MGTLRWLEILAVSLYILHQTESPLLVSLMIFARLMPPLVLGPWIGAAADRIDRARLLRYGLASMLLVSLILMLRTASGQIQFWELAIGAALSGAFWSMEHTVRRPLLGASVGDAQMGRALSLDSATFNATRMLGPLAGGALFTILGLAGVFLFSVLLYGLALAVLRMPALNPHASVPKSPGSGLSLFDLLRDLPFIVRADPRIPAVLVVTAIVNFFGFPYVSMAPVIGDQVLALDPFAIGVLLAAEGAGAFFGAINLAIFSRPQVYLRIFGAGSLVFFVMILVFSCSRIHSLSIVALLVAGLGIAGFSAMQSAILLLAAPPQARSRVMGVLVVCIGSQPFGVLYTGLLADGFSATIALTTISLQGLIALLICFWVWPQLRRA